MTLFARAPLRIDFAGGWTDLPSFADVEGGAAVNAAITLYQHVEAILGDKRIRLHAIDTDQRVTLPSSREITYDGSLDAHKAALNMLPVTGGIEIFTKSDAPEGADLGEAAALEVALLAVLARARGEQYDADELAEFGHLLETQELKQLGARQDQCAAAHGGVQALRFSSEGARTRPLPLTPEQLTDLAEHLVLLYTGHSHLSAAAKARVSGACEAGDTAILDALRRMRDLAAEAEAALAGADWQALATDRWTRRSPRSGRGRSRRWCVAQERGGSRVPGQVLVGAWSSSSHRRGVPTSSMRRRARMSPCSPSGSRIGALMCGRARLARSRSVGNTVVGFRGPAVECRTRSAVMEERHRVGTSDPRNGRSP
jgi:D-glycero-alpha-D-manno-heptose-7-phosphate kinase